MCTNKDDLFKQYFASIHAKGYKPSQTERWDKYKWIEI